MAHIYHSCPVKRSLSGVFMRDTENCLLLVSAYLRPYDPEHGNHGERLSRIRGEAFDGRTCYAFPFR